jgi:hypothetical protein
VVPFNPDESYARTIYVDPSTACITIGGGEWADIVAAIENGAEGSSFCIQNGRYHATVPLPLKSGMSIRGITCNMAESNCASGMELPIILGDSQMDMHWKYESVSDVTISELVFEELRLTFGKKGDDSRTVKNIRLYNLVFLRGHQIPSPTDPYDKGAGDDYLVLLTHVGCSGGACSEVKGCHLLRANGWTGRGMGDINSEGVVFEKNSCGGASVHVHGLFASCLNLKGHNARVLSNTFRRAVDTVTGEQDHGIYAKNCGNVEIKGNLIAGWMADSSGGAIKVSSASSVVIEENVLVTSGVMVNDDTGPVTHITIIGNLILQNLDNFATQRARKVARGIGLFVDEAASNGDALPTSGSQIRIEGNHLFGVDNAIWLTSGMHENMDDGGQSGLIANGACHIDLESDDPGSYNMVGNEVLSKYCEFAAPPSQDIAGACRWGSQGFCCE